MRSHASSSRTATRYGSARPALSRTTSRPAASSRSIDLGATRRAVGLTVRGDDAPSPPAADVAELLRVQARRVRAGQAPQATLPRGVGGHTGGDDR